MNYDFKKKYFVLANFRVDQSSVFGTDNNTSYNGGVGLSWVLSKEYFLSRAEWLEFMRVRVSYGTSGNSRIGSYTSLGIYSFDDTGDDGYNQANYAYPSSEAPNPNLGWEKNYKFNAGMDITTSFRLSLTLEYFHDFIQDMIVSRDVIPETGYSSAQINGANMYNRGIEVGLRAHIFSRSKFKWTSQFNISKIENKVTYLEGLGSDFSTAAVARAQRIGYPTSVIWGYDFAGIDPATGRELYRIDDNIVDSHTLKEVYGNTSYWQPIGNSQPDFYGGFNNQFNIGRSLTVGVNISYAFGADKLVQKELLDNYNTLFNRNLPVNAYYDSWRSPGDVALYPVICKYNPIVSNSTKYLYSVSNIKLNSVNVSYTFRLKNSRIPIDRIRAFINGSNLFFWYMDRSPEGKNGITELKNVYPDMRTISVGINTSF
jgi:hypothetical protein